MRNGLNKILNFGADLKGIFWALRYSRFYPQIESKESLVRVNMRLQQNNIREKESCFVVGDTTPCCM